MGNLLYADVEKSRANEIVFYLDSISASNYINSDKSLFLLDNAIKILGKALFFQLRGKGLCALI